MPDWLTLVLIILATWRVASMLVQEDGPFDLFLRWRRQLGVMYDDDGTLFKVPDRSLAKLFTCLWCMSLWVAPAVYGVWLIATPVVWLLAFSAGAIVVDRLTGSTSL